LSKLIIKQIANQRGINQSKLQIRAGVTMQLLYRYWHNFTKSVELEQLERIAKALNVEPGDLIVSDAKYETLVKSEREEDVVQPLVAV
jgi:DNA-binding Xre family transcriptional regulator